VLAFEKKSTEACIKFLGGVPVFLNGFKLEMAARAKSFSGQTIEGDLQLRPPEWIL